MGHSKTELAARVDGLAAAVEKLEQAVSSMCQHVHPDVARAARVPLAECKSMLAGLLYAEPPVPAEQTALELGDADGPAAKISAADAAADGSAP